MTLCIIGTRQWKIESASKTFFINWVFFCKYGDEMLCVGIFVYFVEKRETIQVQFFFYHHLQSVGTMLHTIKFIMLLMIGVDNDNDDCGGGDNAGGD